MTVQDARVRFEWGQTGAEVVSTGATLVVVVDVLSFTTGVSIAADRGIEVHPYRFQDRSAAEHAQRLGAVLAVGRGVEGGVSLSPASIAAAPGGGPVGRAGVAHREDGGDGVAVVAVVAAGERWAVGSLRPGLEDLWGAGGVLTAPAECGVGDLSPEAAAAAAAAAAFDAVTDLESALSGCTSGRELVESGFAEDVRIAGQLDVSDTVPVLDPSVGSFSGHRGAGWAPSR